MSWLDKFLAIWTRDEGRPVPRGDPARILEVDAVLDELRPMFAADGGAVHLVAIEDDCVVVELRGACVGCSSSAESLHGAVEPKLRERLAWVRRVRAG